jgi:hypothetical protein
MENITWLGIAGLSIVLAIVLLGLAGFIGAGFDWLTDKNIGAGSARFFVASIWVAVSAGLIAYKTGD